jgi:hypothetical protein
MTQYCSIIDTHNKIIQIIPENQINLIDDLIKFIKSNKTKSLKYLTLKIIYIDYLNILLKYLPNRPLKNYDPEWMWNCQDIFSSACIKN